MYLSIKGQNTTKMSLVPFTFKNVELKVVTINGKPWTRAKEVCRALKYDAKHQKLKTS